MDLEYLYWLQQLREQSPAWLNSILFGISEFAAGSLVIVLMVLLYWCIDKRSGERMVFSYVGAMSVSQLLKNIACVYRPWKRDARLHIMPEAQASATGYSFPSGHTTLGTAFYSNMAAFLKKYSKWWILPCAILIFLTGFSRNWLGAHTPQDVIVGWVIALAFLPISNGLLKLADSRKNADIVIAAAGIALAAAMLAYTSLKSYPMDVLEDGTLLVDPWEMLTDCYQAFGALMGMMLGWLIERRFVRFDTAGKPMRRVLRGVVGVLLLLVVRKVLKAATNACLDEHWANFGQMFGLILFAMAGYPAMFTWVHHRWKE